MGSKMKMHGILGFANSYININSPMSIHRFIHKKDGTN